MNGRNRWIRSPGVILPVLLVAAMMAPAAAQAPAEAYRLGPEDVLEVSVWGHADLARTVTVGPDGKISLPLVGVVAAGGLTVDALTRLLTRAYDTYIVNPRVSVSVREYRKLRVSVLGQVVRPGAYALPPGTRLLDAVAAAGGLTEWAAPGETQVVPAGGTALTVDLERAMRGDPAANAPLNGGETIIIPEDVVNLIMIIGEVARPGRYRLRKDMRVLDALVQAGGLTDRASLSEARLVRSSQQSQPLDLQGLLLRQEMARNVLLGPGDTLFIPEDTNGRFYVMGDVKSPGVFVLKGNVTLLQAVALAGGPTPRGAATAKTVYVIRRNGAPQQYASEARIPAAQVESLPNGGTMIAVSFDSLMRSPAGLEARVQAGDVIVMPQTNLSAFEVILTILAGIAGALR